MSDARPIVFAESLEVDFSTNEWKFRALGEYQVGAGSDYADGRVGVSVVACQLQVCQ